MGFFQAADGVHRRGPLRVTFYDLPTVFAMGPAAVPKRQARCRCTLAGLREDPRDGPTEAKKTAFLNKRLTARQNSMNPRCLMGHARIGENENDPRRGYPAEFGRGKGFLVTRSQRLS